MAYRQWFTKRRCGNAGTNQKKMKFSLVDSNMLCKHFLSGVMGFKSMRQYLVIIFTPCGRHQWSNQEAVEDSLELFVKDLILIGNELIDSWPQYKIYSHAFALLPSIMSCPPVAYLTLTGSENNRRRKVGTRFEFNLEHRIMFIHSKYGNGKINSFYPQSSENSQGHLPYSQK